MPKPKSVRSFRMSIRGPAIVLREHFERSFRISVGACSGEQTI
jgi:hypothetical protein